MRHDFTSGERALRFIATLLLENRAYIAGAIALAAVARAGALVLPVSTRYLVDTVLRQRRYELLPAFAFVVGSAIAVQACAAYFLDFLVARRSHEIVCDLRMRLARHVLRLPLVFHDSQASGATAMRITNDTDAIRHVLGFPTIDLVGAMVTAVVSAIVLVRIDVLLAAIGAAMLATCAAGFAVCVVFSRKYVRERSAIIAEGSGRLAEAIGAIRILKTFVAESREEHAYRNNLDRLLANVAKTTGLSSKIATARVMVGGSAGLLLIWAGVHQIASGRLTLGGLLVALVLWTMLANALLEGGAAAIHISESLAGVDRVRELLSLPREDDDPHRTVTFGGGPGSVVFDKVTFSYAGRSAALNRVSFVVAPGSVTAVIGPSGAGKSTIAAIVASLYTPACGRVLVDGYDLRTVELESYRRQVGFVPQDPILMSGTIRENVLLARTGIAEAEFCWACHVARVSEFAERFPAGYNTEIGERGVQLSGGQRQRIAIARALLGNPRILVLDEPTASLDAESAAIVQDALASAMAGRTTILIVHSESMIRLADQVVVLNRGSVVARRTRLATGMADALNVVPAMIATPTRVS